MLRSIAFATSLVVLAPVAVAESAPPQTQLQSPSTTTHYRTLEKMLRKFSRQAGEASRGKIYAQR